ncbi:MAG TPA: hypothetical protein VLB82_03280 [Thermodesulfobacteriota bacterium]|nr:hypothetical protein [Thermodesulfobacteriota bacterium]
MYKKIILSLFIGFFALTFAPSLSYGGGGFSPDTPADSQALSLVDIAGATFPNGQWELERINSDSAKYVCISNNNCQFDVFTLGFTTSPRYCDTGAVVYVAQNALIIPFECSTSEE